MSLSICFFLFLIEIYDDFSRELTRILYEENSVKLSDDENEEDDDDNRNSNTVLSELTDKTIEHNSINQNNSNDNQPLLHSYENQM